MTAAETIDQAFLQLTFAVKLLTFIELGKLSKTDFDGAVVIELAEDFLKFDPGTFNSYDDIILAAQNQYSITLGFTAVTMDEVLESAGFKRNLAAGSPHRDLRDLVYMIRCAFAHDMMHPKWAARGPFLRDFRIASPGGPIEVDMGKLNGKPLEMEDLGGPKAFFKIKDEVKRILLTPNLPLERKGASGG